MNPSRRDWSWWSLLAAAVLSRLVWVIWVHPPSEHVFSDMAHYVHRAGLVAGFSVDVGDRMMVWQAWGTHVLLAVPMLLMGSREAALDVAGLMWAGFSAGTVMLGYQLAARVLPGPANGPHWPALAVGVALLGWFPLLSHTGFFVSETPYTCALLAMTLAIVRMQQEGRGAAGAGLWGAFAFALRPQSAVFFLLLALAWAYERLRFKSAAFRLDRRQLIWLLAPLLVVLAISMVRVRVHTGRFGGVAENGQMNLTAGRCHNIVTRSWSSEADLASSLATGYPPPDRRISLPGFRALGREGPDHPLALRPALGGEAIDLVGYIGDPEVHREIRRRCYAATGIGGQIHYTITNVALSWFVARPWPESSDQWAPELLPVAVRGRQIAAAVAPLSLLGMFLVLVGWARGSPGPARGSPGPARGRSRDQLGGGAVCALQFLSLLIVTAVFFGDPRLRVPYDPYALILALVPVSLLVSRLRARA